MKSKTPNNNGIEVNEETNAKATDTVLCFASHKYQIQEARGNAIIMKYLITNFRYLILLIFLAITAIPC